MKYTIVTGSAAEVSEKVSRLMQTCKSCKPLSLTSTISNSNNQIVYAQAVSFGYSEADVITLKGAKDYDRLKGMLYWLGASIESVIRHADDDDDSFLFTIENDPTRSSSDKNRPEFYAITKGQSDEKSLSQAD